MRNFKKVIGFLVFMFVIVLAVPSVASAAEQQYTENLIPAMTSNTSPSGVASASSFYNDSNGWYHPAWYAFDHTNNSTGNGWISSNFSTTGWLEYDFAKEECIAKYTIISRNPVYDIKELPKNWTFEAFDEIANEWKVLDTQINITDWTNNVKKEFTFSNNKQYHKYRINITANNGNANVVVIGELEMMASLTPQIAAPVNLTAVAGDAKINLTWNAVSGATSYNIKRSTTAGGPYTTISSATGSATTYTDTGLTNGTTYYYVVTAATSNGESGNSNEVSATPIATTDPSTVTGNRAILVISFINGKEKEYDLSAMEIDKFVNWYDGRSEGLGKSYFTIQKHSNVKPFIGRKEYIKFENIESFEIKDYNDN